MIAAGIGIKQTIGRDLAEPRHYSGLPARVEGRIVLVGVGRGHFENAPVPGTDIIIDTQAYLRYKDAAFLIDLSTLRIIFFNMWQLLSCVWFCCSSIWYRRRSPMLRSISVRAVTVISVCLIILLGTLFFLSNSKVRASGQSQLVPLVTDQTPLGLPGVFGVAGGGIVNQDGDYAFLGNGASGVFYRRAGAAAAVRIMQMGDEVPGFPGSRADLIQTLRFNNSALLAFRVDFFQANGLGQGIIFTFDGTTLRRIVAGTDPAPGGGGANFERQINLVGLNDAGDIAFTAPLVPSGSILPLQTTLYIVPNGGAPV